MNDDFDNSYDDKTARIEAEKAVDWTYLRVTKSTREKLKEIGSKGESYDRVINRLIKLFYGER
ncbi:MAG: hypothetical protein ABSC64_02120 [Candidatus Korobacteraceae bacterium]|jgi:hypothetical protein